MLLACCAATVRDVPAPGAADALVAGRLAFGGTRIGATMWLRGPGGREIIVRPEAETFLVALPPGTYELRRFGSFAISDDRVTFEVAPGQARYIGTFRATRDPYGKAGVRVVDERGEVARALEARYGPETPALEPGLVASSLEPLAPGDLVIALRKVEHTYPPYAHIGFYVF